MMNGGHKYSVIVLFLYTTFHYCGYLTTQVGLVVIFVCHTKLIYLEEGTVLILFLVEFPASMKTESRVIEFNKCLLDMDVWVNQ